MSGKRAKSRADRIGWAVAHFSFNSSIASSRMPRARRSTALIVVLIESLALAAVEADMARLFPGARAIPLGQKRLLGAPRFAPAHRGAPPHGWSASLDSPRRSAAVTDA